MKQRSPVISILYAVLFALIFIIVAGTIFVFAGRQAQPGKGLRNAEPAPEVAPDQFETYTDIGQIRAVTSAGPEADGQRVTIILEPWFAYETADTAFREELAGKRQKIRSIFTNYFLSRTYDQLVRTGESGVKAELLSQLNNELVMGHIDALYFEQYLFLE